MELSRLIRAERQARSALLQAKEAQEASRQAVVQAIERQEAATARMVERSRELALRRRELRAARDSLFSEEGESEASQFQLSDGYRT
eukprot:600902-Lingulodinium_polyedra.AAC.1